MRKQSKNVKNWEEVTIPVPWGHVAGNYLYFRRIRKFKVMHGCINIERDKQFGYQFNAMIRLKYRQISYSSFSILSSYNAD